MLSSKTITDLEGSATGREALIRVQQRAYIKQHAGGREVLCSVTESEQPERSEQLRLKDELKNNDRKYKEKRVI